MAKNTKKPSRANRPRRDVLALAAWTMGVAGAGFTAWPFIASLGPGAEARALATVDVDLSAVSEGQAITVVWRGKPVFIRRRMKAKISAVRAVALEELPVPETDESRVRRAQWLVVLGVCPHLGCVLQGQRDSEPRGDYGGWFCSCHGSHFDESGRVRKGPAPGNLAVPPYRFREDGTLVIG